MAHKKELDYMNGIGCLLVVLIHVLSIGVTQADHSSWLGAAVYLPWRLAACAVPMFFYTGAVKAALQFGDAALTPKVYSRYILRRFTKIYLPYAVWAAVYFLYFQSIGYVQGGVKRFVFYLLTGKLSAQFYYVVVVMQFYLLMPVWVWMLRHVRAEIAIGVSLVIRLCMLQLPTVLASFGIEFSYTDCIFLTYLVFWAAGLYAGKHYGTFAPITRKHSVRIASILLIAVYACLSLRGYITSGTLLNLNRVKILTDLLSIVLLHGATLRLAEADGPLPKLLGGVHKASFSVFLSHCLFLTAVTVNLENAGVTRLSVLLTARFLVCYTVPFLLYYVTAAGSSLRRRIWR